MSESSEVDPMAAAIDLEELHAGSRRNRSSLAKAAICGCFHCLSEFPSERIVEWTDNSETAICPICGVDAVLSFDSPRIDKQLLRQMHDHWFKTSRRLKPAEWKKALEKNAW